MPAGYVIAQLKITNLKIIKNMLKRLHHL